MSSDRIAVLRALPGIGDMLCAVPALRAVRAARPGAHITLVGLAATTWLPERRPDLCDDLLVVEGVAGLPEVTPDPPAARRFAAAARARHFDLALQLHGSGITSNPLLTVLGARHQVSAHLPGRWAPPGTSITYPPAAHEVHRLLAVVGAAGFPSQGDDIDLPVRPEDRRRAAVLAGRHGLGTAPIACLHPGASRSANRWPAPRFGALGDRLAGAGLRVVLTGTAAERPVAREVAASMDAPSTDLTGATDLGTLAALFARASVVVSNDTGAAHVAAATGAPSVVVFAPDGDPDRWAPLDRARHLPAQAPGRWPTVAEVTAAVDAQLAGGDARRLDEAGV